MWYKGIIPIGMLYFGSHYKRHVPSWANPILHWEGGGHFVPGRVVDHMQEFLRLMSCKYFQCNVPPLWKFMVKRNFAHTMNMLTDFKIIAQIP